MKPFFWICVIALLLLRVPSLAQPAGADQGLYAYVGQRIGAGDVPYRDAWDQKPPAVHYTYALLLAIWPKESVVAAADLLVAAATGWTLVLIGRRLAGGVAPGAGELAAVLFLLLGNPVYTRLGGVRVRSQCETFIGLALAGAMAALVRGWPAGSDAGSANGERGSSARFLVAGIWLGLAFTYKYNAIVYALLVPVALRLGSDTGHRRPAVLGAIDRPKPFRLLLIAAAGFAMPLGAVLIWFGLAGALDDLYQATVRYNLVYSGETYADAGAFVRYLVTFPLGHARVDSLWLLGGAGCAVLLAAAWLHRPFLLAVAWTVAACLSIAINGSRGLPQYFVQAAPALALAAGLAGTWIWRQIRWLPRLLLMTAVATAVWRVTAFDKALEYTLYDFRGLTGQAPRHEYLSRFGGQRAPDRAEKYIALDQARLGELLAASTSPAETVFIFGFSSGAYVQAKRRSASRFFWSRPIIVGFNAGRPGYGPEGLLQDLVANRPRVVVLQRNDWELEGIDSAGYFLGQPQLAAWLKSAYEHVRDLDNYEIWIRRGPGAD